MSRGGHRVRGHIKKRNHTQRENERSLRRLRDEIYKQQAERRRADEEFEIQQPEADEWIGRE